MPSYLEMTKPELQAEFATVKAEYEKLRSMHLSLDMSRGKPGFDNMDISQKMFDLVGNDTGFKNIDGIDCRNYGGLDGLIELKKVLAPRVVERYNQYPAAGVTAVQKPGTSTGQAMTEVENLVKELPKGYDIAWSGMSYQEKNSSGQVGYLLAFAIIL